MDKKKKRKINSRSTWTDFSDKELLEMGELFSKQNYLTVSETGIGLRLCPNTVRRMIKRGDIIAFKAFGTSAVRIDVAKTKEHLDKLSNYEDHQKEDE